MPLSGEKYDNPPDRCERDIDEAQYEHTSQNEPSYSDVSYSSAYCHHASLRQSLVYATPSVASADSDLIPLSIDLSRCFSAGFEIWAVRPSANVLK